MCSQSGRWFFRREYLYVDILIDRAGHFYQVHYVTRTTFLVIFFDWQAQERDFKARGFVGSCFYQAHLFCQCKSGPLTKTPCKIITMLEHVFYNHWKTALMDVVVNLRGQMGATAPFYFERTAGRPFLVRKVPLIQTLTCSPLTVPIRIWSEHVKQGVIY